MVIQCNSEIELKGIGIDCSGNDWEEHNGG